MEIVLLIGLLFIGCAFSTTIATLGSPRGKSSALLLMGLGLGMLLSVIVFSLTSKAC